MDTTTTTTTVTAEYVAQRAYVRAYEEWLTWPASYRAAVEAAEAEAAEAWYAQCGD